MQRLPQGTTRGPALKSQLKTCGDLGHEERELAILAWLMNVDLRSQ